jgi:Ca-activated chloride channel family protein
MEIHLMRPEWLWSLVPALWLMALLWRRRGRSGSWSDVIAPELLPYLVGDNAGPRSINLLPLVLLGWVLAALAASGPSWEKIPQPIHQKQDALVLVLDLSYSMKSSDLAPSRLDRARQKLLDLLEHRREGQTGLIAFAGDAHIVTPLTDDTPTIANLLPALNPDMMPVPGSAAPAAVTLALELLHSAGIRQGRILLVTDGVAGKDHKKLTKALAGSGAQLSIMGVGTATGAPIPLPRGGFLKDDAGTIVMPGLEERELRKLASDSGGRYQRIQIDDADLDYLLRDSVLPDTRQTLTLERTADTWNDQGYLFVLALLPLVLGLFRRGWIIGLLPLLLLAQPQPATAQNWDDLWLTPDQQGQRAMTQGDQEGAATLFENPEWAGTAAYESGDYEAASEHFSSAESADGWYNRGNALARAGRIDEAIAAYQESLQLLPDQGDARENLELLEQMKQEQEQEQQQQDQQEQDQNQQEQEQEQDQNQQQDQQQGEQGQPQDQSGQPPDQADGQQDQQNPEREEQDSEQQSGKDEQDGQQQEQQQEEEQQTQEGEAEREQEQQAQATQADPEEQERDQAMEQWLRRVPDDPSGLLREKFRYESRQRQEQGAPRDNETYW